MHKVFVLDKNKKPLMPCSAARARALLTKKRAAVYKLHPFNPQGERVAEIASGKGYKAEFDQGTIHSLIQYEEGQPEGIIKRFTTDGALFSTFSLKSGKKEGEEWEYYLSTKTDKPLAKLMISWHEDQIQGMVKTWYPNGALESEREMSSNKKHGLSFAYYSNGDLMLMEEYENDKLNKGSYYKKGIKEPVSTIENGQGTATLYTAQGYFSKKISYEHGQPVVDAP